MTQSTEQALNELRDRVARLEAQQQENSAFIAWLQDDETVTDPIPGEPAEGESDDGGA